MMGWPESASWPSSRADRGSSAGTTDQLATFIAADEGAHDVAAGAGGRMPTDVLVAADTDRPCQRPSRGPRWWPVKSPHPSG
jgi:hypothetical protein